MPQKEKYETDVLVIGAGVSGYCAAIQAARAGADVVLLEKDSVLGGNSGPNLGVHISGADRYHHFSSETGIIGQLSEEKAWCMAQTQVSPGTLNCNISRRYEAIVQTALEAAGVRLLKRHEARRPIVEGGRIVGVEVEDTAAFCTKQIDVRHVVIEASGDGEIGALAGAEFRFGRESQREHGERSAPAEADCLVQGSSLMAIAQNTHRPIEFVPPPGLPPFQPRLWFHKPGDAWHERAFRDELDLIFLYVTETGGQLDTIRDDGAIYETLLKQLWAEWDHLKNGPHRGLTQTWDLVWVSPKAGKRESRRFLGDVIVTQQDLEDGRIFPDAVAYGGFDLDVHEPAGDTADIVSYSIPPLYSIAYRALYSRNVQNLFLAGRLISATHLAHSSTRLMRTGGAIGQAVGMAAAMCVENRCGPRQLAADQKLLEQLQQRLLRHDATILGVSNSDPSDLARRASVEASSETVFNEQRLDDWLPMDRPRGLILYDWPARPRRVELYLRNKSDRAKTARLKLSRADSARRWKTHEEFTAWRWRDCRAERFKAIAKFESNIAPKSEGWVCFTLPDSFELDAKDPACEEDRLLCELAADAELEWGVCETPCEIALSVEKADDGSFWRPLVDTKCTDGGVEYPDPHMPPPCLPHGRRLLLRIDPPPPLGEAQNVINGHNRRLSSGPANMWISRCDAPLPQSITLRFPSPVTCNSVIVTFDTLADDYHQMPHNYGPRAAPMCVKNYRIETCAGGKWHTVVRVEGNYNRRRVHEFTRQNADALRLVVESVNDETRYSARVYEIRVYDRERLI